MYVYILLNITLYDISMFSETEVMNLTRKKGFTELFEGVEGKEKCCNYILNSI